MHADAKLISKFAIKYHILGYETDILGQGMMMIACAWMICRLSHDFWPESEVDLDSVLTSSISKCWK